MMGYCFIPQIMDKLFIMLIKGEKMKTIIYDRNKITDYKTFYENIVVELDANRFIDWNGEQNLNYDGNILNEFLWYCHEDSIHFVFQNFDLQKIENNTNYENYQWNIIFTVIKRFVSQYPNNTLEFIDCL